MAVKNIAVLKTAQHEGGYALPYGTSGETYCGIDRLHAPSWAGWKIIDRIKNTTGIKPYQFVKGNAELDKHVVDFYQKFWVASNAEKIKNTELANFYFDFYFHKPAIAVAFLNQAAEAIAGKLSFSKGSVSAAVTNVINANTNEIYSKLYQFRLAHYSKGLHPEVQYYAGDKLKYIKSRNGLVNRTKTYPETIGPVKKKMVFPASFLNYYL